MANGTIVTAYRVNGQPCALEHATSTTPHREWEDDQLLVSAMLGWRHNSDRFIYDNRAMNLIVLLIILIILFGGGGLYYGGPYVGGGLGTGLLIILIVLLLR
jgi:hypothetical protein